MLGLLKRTFSSKVYQNIIHTTEAQTSIIQLNRPKALNALNALMISELNECLAEIEQNEAIKTIILTGNERAFAAGADIKEMSGKNFSEVFNSKMLDTWKFITTINKPIIAAVSGHALGGGFELALMCDLIYASKSAKFGLPEVTLGTIPGSGGTQRLIREVGKSKAMEMILTAEIIGADEAFRLGIVSKVAENEVLEEAKKTAEKMNKFSGLALSMAKNCINKAYETGLREGVDYEQKAFWSTFATEDRKEGMLAFIEKRKANFKNN